MQHPIDTLVILTENIDTDNHIRTNHKSSVAINFPSMMESYRYFSLYLNEVTHLYIDLDSKKAPADIAGFMRYMWGKKPDLKITLVSLDIHTLMATKVDPTHFKLLPTTNFKS